MDSKATIEVEGRKARGNSPLGEGALTRNFDYRWGQLYKNKRKTGGIL